MDEEDRKMFRKTMLKAAGMDDDPIEEFTRASVKKLISGLRRDTRQELRDEVKRWNLEKQKLEDDGKTETDAVYASAKEIHDLIRADLEEDLKDLKTKK